MSSKRKNSRKRRKPTRSPGSDPSIENSVERANEGEMSSSAEPHGKQPAPANAPKKTSNGIPPSAKKPNGKQAPAQKSRTTLSEQLRRTAEQREAQARRRRQRLTILGVAVGVALLAALVTLVLTRESTADASDVPAGAAAIVGETPIPEASVRRWMQSAARESAATTGGSNVPDAPSFRGCIADGRKQNSEVEGAIQLSDEELRSQCEQTYNELREQALRLLVSTQWLENAARDLNVSLPASEVERAFSLQSEELFPEAGDFADYLAQQGLTRADVKTRIRANLLAAQIREALTEQVAQPTPDEIRNYYQINKDDYGTPERRDLQLIRTEGQERARAAFQMVEDDKDSFKAAVKRYSSDPSVENDGKISATREQLEPGLEEAVFSTDEDELVGPVEGQFGFYVFRVTEIEDATQQTVEQAGPAIKERLRTQREIKVLKDFAEEWEPEQRKLTVCAEDWLFSFCANGPDPEDEAAEQGAPGPGQQLPPGAQQPPAQQPPSGPPPPPTN